MRPAGGGAGEAARGARPAGGGEPRPPQRARSRNLPGDARFALDALPALTTRPDQIKALRQTILNLAVRGKLVPQDPNDEPASELLAAHFWRRKTAKRLVKRDKTISYRASWNDVRGRRYSLPDSWLWMQLSGLITVDGRRMEPASENRPKERSGRWGVSEDKRRSDPTFDFMQQKELPGQVSEPRPQH